MILKECIKELIVIEENASALYERESRNSDDRLETAMKAFAKEESNHRDALLFQLEKIEDKAVVISEEIVSRLNRQKDHLKKGIGTDPSQKEFFKFALQMERNSVELYETLLENFAPETSYGKTFAEFVPEEKRHMIFILNILHHMV
jgi:rubrerythrin